ncbi:MAG: hypothetical protein KC502_17885 [Myxococcales bacterium]|nr:hypothetical protein [Myxococcales bacterium]
MCRTRTLGVVVGLLLTAMALPVFAASAPAYPDTSKMTPAFCSTGQASDTVKDAAGALNERDIVGDSKHPALLTYRDKDFFYTRIRLNADPVVSKGGNSPLAQFGWGFGIDVDNDTKTIEYAVIASGIVEKLMLTNNVDKKNEIKSWAPLLDQGKQGANGQTFLAQYAEVRKADDGSKFGGDDDYFLTIAVPIAESEDATKSNSKPLKWSKIRVWVGTSSNGHTLDKDYMCWDDTTGGVQLDKAVSDPIIAGAYVEITGPKDGKATTVTPTITGLAPPNAKVEVTLNGKKTTVTADQYGVWTLKVPASLGLKDETSYTIKADTTDPVSGKSATTSGPLSISTGGKVDITAPGKDPVKTITPTISGTATPEATVTVELNGKKTTVKAGKDGKWSVTVPKDFGLEDDKTYKAKASVTVGGSTKFDEQDIKIATGAAVKITSPGKDPVTTTTPTLTGTATPGATVTLELNGKKTSVKAGSDGKWSFKVPADWGLVDGKTYKAKASVTMGGVTKTDEQDVVVAIPAFVEITNPDKDPLTSTTPTITGKTKPNEKVTITLNGKTATVTADKDGNWSHKVPKDWGLANNKTYKVKATVTEDGKDTSDEKDLKVNTGMLVTISSPKTAPTTTPVVSGKSKPGAKVTVTINGKTATVTAGTDGSWKFTVPANWGLAFGKTYKVTADATDGSETAKATQDLKVEASCTDKVANGTETDVDCGGTCKTKCADTKGCKAGADCTSGTCDTSAKDPVCIPAPTCTDKKMNGDETDVDCGGSCKTKCNNGKMCKAAADCNSANCNTSANPQVCAAKPPSCTDGKMNGDETDVDCGGSCTKKCKETDGCKNDADCDTNKCDTAVKLPVCVTIDTCTDGKLSGDETDVDCGGTCKTKCPDAKACKIGPDCKSGICDTQAKAPVCMAPPSCTDKIKNGDETDVDCGGSCKTKCSTGKGCKANADCTDDVCDDKAKPPVCLAPASCTDGKINGDETDVDCGGSCKTKCKDDDGCKAGSDCESGKCDAQAKAPVCVPGESCTDKIKNGDETDVDCGGSCTDKCDDGKGCKTGSDCTSDSCDDKASPAVCAKPASCTDGKKNGDETDVDCGGSCSDKCKVGKGCKADGDCDNSVCDKDSDPSLCTEPVSCTDGKTNGDESDVDCGGSCPDKCVDDKACTKNGDCKSDVCDTDASSPICKPAESCTDGKKNGDETDNDCGGTCETKCVQGESCKVDSDCVTKFCTAGGVCRRGCVEGVASQLDCDADGLLDVDEDKNKNGKVDDGETDPFNADSDGDGVNDGDEVKNGTDPTAADLKLYGGGCSSGSSPVGTSMLLLLMLALLLVAARRRSASAVISRDEVNS